MEAPAPSPSSTRPPSRADIAAIRVAHVARSLWWRVAKPRTLGVRGLVVDGDGRVCLVRHTYMPRWYFPGGGVKRSETLVDAVRREVFEEAGIAMTGPPHG